MLQFQLHFTLILNHNPYFDHHQYFHKVVNLPKNRNLIFIFCHFYFLKSPLIRTFFFIHPLSFLFIIIPFFYTIPLTLIALHFIIIFSHLKFLKFPRHYSTLPITILIIKVMNNYV